MKQLECVETPDVAAQRRAKHNARCAAYRRSRSAAKKRADKAARRESYHANKTTTTPAPKTEEQKQRSRAASAKYKAKMSESPEYLARRLQGWRDARARKRIRREQAAAPKSTYVWLDDDGVRHVTPYPSPWVQMVEADKAAAIEARRIVERAASKKYLDRVAHTPEHKARRAQIAKNYRDRQLQQDPNYKAKLEKNAKAAAARRLKDPEYKANLARLRRENYAANRQEIRAKTKPDWNAAPEWANWLVKYADDSWGWRRKYPVQLINYWAAKRCIELPLGRDSVKECCKDFLEERPHEA